MNVSVAVRIHVDVEECITLCINLSQSSCRKVKSGTGTA